MATVKANVLKKGVVGTNTTGRGRSCAVTYIVSELVGTSDPGAWVFDAMDVAGIPTLGSSLDDDNYPFLTAKSITSEALKSGSQFIIVVSYGLPSASDIPATEPSIPENAIVTVGTTVVEIENAFDIEGKEIFTQHGGADKPKVRGSVRYHSPSTTITYTRRELGSPGTFASIYVGAVNSLGVFGDGPGTWLCTGIPGTSNDGGVTYVVTYNFQRSPKIGRKPGTSESFDTAQPWDPLIIQIDKETGDFVKNAVMDEGMKIVPVYRRVPFLDLNLALSG